MITTRIVIIILTGHWQQILTLPLFNISKPFVNVADLLASIITIFNRRIKVQYDCTEVLWLRLSSARIKLMELNHFLLDDLDGFITVLSLHYFNSRIQLKYHFHRLENKRLIIYYQNLES